MKKRQNDGHQGFDDAKKPTSIAAKDWFAKG
jgi:hypothetical protein